MLGINSGQNRSILVTPHFRVKIVCQAKSSQKNLILTKFTDILNVNHISKIIFEWILTNNKVTRIKLPLNSRHFLE